MAFSSVTVNVYNSDGTGGCVGLSVQGAYRYNGVVYELNAIPLYHNCGDMYEAIITWVNNHALSGDAGESSMYNNIDIWYIRVKDGDNVILYRTYNSQPLDSVDIYISYDNPHYNSPSLGGAGLITEPDWEVDSSHTAYKIAENICGEGDISDSSNIESYVLRGGVNGHLTGFFKSISPSITSSGYYKYYLYSNTLQDYNGVALCASLPSGSVNGSAVLSSALNANLFNTTSYITGVDKIRMIDISSLASGAGKYFVYRKRASYSTYNDTTLDTVWVTAIKSSSTTRYWHRIEFDPFGGDFANLHTKPSGVTFDIFYTKNYDRVACTAKRSLTTYSWTLRSWCPTVIKEGYNFVGWGEEEYPIEIINSIITISSGRNFYNSGNNKTLYAIWDESDSNWVLDSTHTAFRKYEDLDFWDVNTELSAVSQKKLRSYKFEAGTNAGAAFEIKTIELNPDIEKYDFYISSSTQDNYDGVALCKNMPPIRNLTFQNLYQVLTTNLYTYNSSNPDQCSCVTGVENKHIEVEISNLSDQNHPKVYIVYRRNSSGIANENACWFSYGKDVSSGNSTDYKYKLITDANGGSFRYQDNDDGSYFNYDHTKMYYVEDGGTSQTKTWSLNSTSIYSNRLNDRPGYRFLGWAIDTVEDVVPSVTANGSPGETVELTVYAKWEEVYDNPRLGILLTNANLTMLGDEERDYGNYPVYASGNTYGEDGNYVTYQDSAYNFPYEITLEGLVYNIVTHSQKPFSLVVHLNPHDVGNTYMGASIIMKINNTVVSNIGSQFELRSENSLGKTCFMDSGVFSLTETSVHSQSGNTKNITKSYNYSVGLAPLGNCLFSGNPNPIEGIPNKTSLGTTYRNATSTVDNCMWLISFHIAGFEYVYWGEDDYEDIALNPKLGNGCIEINHTNVDTYYCYGNSTNEFLNFMSNGTGNTNATKWCIAFNVPIYQSPNVGVRLSTTYNPTGTSMQVGQTKAVTVKLIYTSGSGKTVTPTITTNPTGIVNVT